jgi:hypothetical protein
MGMDADTQPASNMETDNMGGKRGDD